MLLTVAASPRLASAMLQMSSNGCHAAPQEKRPPAGVGWRPVPCGNCDQARSSPRPRALAGLAAGAGLASSRLEPGTLGTVGHLELVPFGAQVAPIEPQGSGNDCML